MITENDKIDWAYKCEDCGNVIFMAEEIKPGYLAECPYCAGAFVSDRDAMKKITKHIGKNADFCPPYNNDKCLIDENPDATCAQCWEAWAKDPANGA